MLSPYLKESPFLLTIPLCEKTFRVHLSALAKLPGTSGRAGSPAMPMLLFRGDGVVPNLTVGQQQPSLQRALLHGQEKDRNQNQYVNG